METSHVFRQRRRNGEEIATSGGGAWRAFPGSGKLLEQDRISAAPQGPLNEDTLRKGPANGKSSSTQPEAWAERRAPPCPAPAWPRGVPVRVAMVI